MHDSIMRYISSIVIVFSLALMMGCKKKEQAVAAPPAPEQPVANAQPAPDQASGAAAAAPVEPITTAPADTGQALTAAESARKTKDYEKAAATLLQIQQRRLSDQQAAAAAAQMQQLQRDLVNGVASGDANAKAAADLLRQANAHH